VERALPGVGNALRRILSRGLGADLGDVHQAEDDRHGDRGDVRHAKQQLPAEIEFACNLLSH